MAFLTDVEIDALIKEKKSLPSDFPRRTKLREKSGHKEASFDTVGVDGSVFRVILRESEENSLDFSVILGYEPSDSEPLFRLRRYNGKSHEHTNHLEQTTFYGFHIHQATERYQRSLTPGIKEDSYAEPTDRYADIRGALRCLLTDCGFDQAAFQYELPEPKL